MYIKRNIRFFGIMQTVISSERKTLVAYLKETWSFRAFILVLAKRDVKIKYAQTFLGLAWTVLQPLVAVVVFTLFFNVLLELQADYPYALYVLSGMLCWGLFNYIFSQGSASLLNNQDLIGKVNFPKIVLPLSKVLVGGLEFLITMVLMIILMLWFQVPLTLNIIFLPLIVLVVVAFSLATSLILAAATIRYRDLHHIIPFLVNFGIWFTPVFYPVSLIPEQYGKLLYLNPMASLIGLFRWSLLGDPVSVYALSGVLMTIILLAAAVTYFNVVEDTIAETI